MSVVRVQLAGPEGIGKEGYTLLLGRLPELRVVLAGGDVGFFYSIAASALQECAGMSRSMSFAYFVAVIMNPKGIDVELLDLYHGDIIEAVMDAEELATSPDHIWPFGWESKLLRVAPVQLTRGWDPRQELCRLLHSRPRFQASDGCILVFSQIKAIARFPSVDESTDFGRFQAILHATVSRARATASDLLFVGGRGWDYESDNVRLPASLVARAQFRWSTRHP